MTNFSSIKKLLIHFLLIMLCKATPSSFLLGFMMAQLLLASLKIFFLFSFLLMKTQVSAPVHTCHTSTRTPLLSSKFFFAVHLRSTERMGICDAYPKSLCRSLYFVTKEKRKKTRVGEEFLFHE